MKLFIGVGDKTMLNTTVLRQIRTVEECATPQHDVLQLAPFEETPIPTFKVGYRGGVDFMNGDSYWTVSLPPCRVGRFTCITGDGKPGFEKDNPSKNVYELHLRVEDISLRPISGVLALAQEWTYAEPEACPESTAACDTFEAWKENCRVPNTKHGIVIRQNVWYRGEMKYIPLYENGVEVTGTTELRENDLVRVEARLSGYEVHADSYGFTIRFGPRGVHILERASESS